MANSHDPNLTIQDLVTGLQNAAKPSTLQEDNERAESEGRPKKVIHNGRVYEVAKGNELEVDSTNPELAATAEEQLSGKTLSPQEKAEREQQMRRALRDNEDVLVVTDTGRTQVRTIRANRDRSAEVLYPQPGPVVQMVNDKNIAQAVPELNTQPAGDFKAALEDRPNPQLENPATNEAARLGESNFDEAQKASKSGASKKAKGTKGGGSKDPETNDPEKSEGTSSLNFDQNEGADGSDENK